MVKQMQGGHAKATDDELVLFVSGVYDLTRSIFD